MKKLKEFIKSNLFFILIFFLINLLFLYQHKNSLSWDFSAYVLNAKYFFYGGSYFEVLRPPLSPLILGATLLLGVFGEYLYIILVTSLFFYANLKLSGIIFEKYIQKGINKKVIQLIFLIFSLSVFVLINSTKVGTELLALSFFELFLFYFFSGKVSGYWLGLAFLTRYTFLIYAPLMLLKKDYKKIIKNILSFGLVIFPWFFFNYIKFGNWFASFIDSYGLNIYYRDYLFQSINYLDFCKIIGIFLPFFILGLFLAVVKFFKTKEGKWKKNKEIIIFAAILILGVISYKNIPLKEIRYLFDTSLPIAYFCSLSTIFLIIKSKNFRKIIAIILIILFLISYSAGVYTVYKDSANSKSIKKSVLSSAIDMKELGIEKCQILTPQWVTVNYFTENAYPLGRMDIQSILQENKIVLIFYNQYSIDDPDILKEIEKYPKLKETKDYVFLAKENFDAINCSKKYINDKPIFNNHCEILSFKFEKLKLDKIVLKICKAINKN